MTPAAFNIDSSFLISTLDLAQPLWATKLYDPYGAIDIKEMTMLMDMSGRETVGNITGVHYELDRPTTWFAAGALFTVAGAQNIQTGPLAAGLVNADGTSAVRVGDHLKDNVSMIVYQVDSKSTANPPVVTLRPLTTGFSTAIPSGRILSYTGRSEKERSSPTGQVVRGTTAYSWYSQITRDEMELSGTAENIGLKPAVLQDGTPLNGWNTVQTRDTEARVLRNMFGSFLFGQNTASAQANTAISLSTTQGLDQVVRQRGWSLNLGATAITYNDLLTCVNNIKAQGATEFYQIWAPNKRIQEMNAFLLAQYANSLNPTLDKVYEQMFFGSNANHTALRSVFSWQTVTLGGGINFAIKELNLLNNPTTFNVNQTPASMFQNLMYFLPMGKENITIEGGKTISANYVTVLNRGKYKDRWMLMRQRGLTSSGANDGIDHMAVDFLVDFGYRFVTMNRFGIVY